MAPQVSVKIVAPPNTVTVMSRRTGPKDQSISFAPQEKKITWTINNFPGGSYAQAFIRVTSTIK